MCNYYYGNMGIVIIKVLRITYEDSVLLYVKTELMLLRLFLDEGVRLCQMLCVYNGCWGDDAYVFSSRGRV